MKGFQIPSVLFLLLLAIISYSRDFRSIPTDPTPGDTMIQRYFEAETEKISKETVRLIDETDDWDARVPELRAELQDMLGLKPFPEKTDLKPVITGQFEHDGVIVEKLHFQSRPGLYVTANYYRPKEQDGPLPTILYVCGHGRVKIDGISYGTKANYQHHPLWFARNGYTCLIIDTLQLGEIEGIHHGTYRYNRWWWNARGYTSAGVEAWNGIRAIDYLVSRPEVDAARIGVTGRSGGGAYTFWIAALDERIKVAAPVAGITSMKNHVVDGCIEGHCDCMFMVNSRRWDFPLLAATIAPRPLMILNTDKDRIFPTDGVVDLYLKTEKVYENLGAKDHLGLAFYEGPHKDTQPLRVAAFHWFDRHLKGESIDYEIPQTTAPKEFEPGQLRVFEQLPDDEINTSIDETFVPKAPQPKVPAKVADWTVLRDTVLKELRQLSFAGWPSTEEPLQLKLENQTTRDGITFSQYSFNSQSTIQLPLHLVHRKGLKPDELDLVVLNVLDDETWIDFAETFSPGFPGVFPGLEPSPDRAAYEAELGLHRSMKWGMAYLPARGIGPTAWTSDEKERIQIRRRFALLGQTLDGMRTWDVMRGIEALRSIEGMEQADLWLQSNGAMAGNTLYASLFTEKVHRLDLHQLPPSHRDGPYYLNVLRITDLPLSLAIASERSQVRLYSETTEAWQFPAKVAKALEWEGKPFELRKPVEP